MNSVLSLEFIKHIDKVTEGCTNEGPRLLHVDGHGTHMTLDFLNYAKSRDIIVLGYPPHTTHLLQGLDVVIFGALKNAYAKYSDQHTATCGRDVEKDDFLMVMGKAVDDAFTESNIHAAWRKTGLQPVDPSVITPEMLAASKPFSIEESFPVEPLSPIRNVVLALRDMNLGSSSVESDGNSISSPSTPTPISHLNLFPSHQDPLKNPLSLLDTQADQEPHSDHSVTPIAVRAIVEGLEGTRAAFLVSSDPVSPSAEIPPPPQQPFPSKVVNLVRCLKDPPNSQEWSLIRQTFLQSHDRLQQSLAREVLQDLHCMKLRVALANAQKRSKKKRTNAHWVLGTSEGRILTGEVMLSALEADQQMRQEKEASKAQRKATSELRKEANDWRSSVTATRKAVYAQSIAEWEAKCAAIPRGRKKPEKPKMPPREVTPEPYKPFSRKKKSQKSTIVEPEGSDSEDGWSDEDEDEDESSSDSSD
jgi:hypothetical protein